MTETSSVVYYLIGDHLGSTSSTVDAAGTLVALTRYKPFGEQRYTFGDLLTDYKYTGQREDEYGLYDYKARHYDPLLGRWLQPDSINPDQYNPLDWDRYAYVRNSPTNFKDSSGHCIDGVFTIVCAMVIGAAVSVAVDAYVTTQINHEEYSWQRAGVAAAAGALSGGIGAGIIAPLAAIAGATAGALSVVPVGATAAVEIGTEAVVGATLAAEANIFISSGQRTAIQALEGEDVSFETYRSNIRENKTADAVFGAAGYTLGWGLGSAINYSFPIIPNGMNSSSSQQMIIGGMQAGGQALSNSTLLDSVFNRPSKPKSEPPVGWR